MHEIQKWITTCHGQKFVLVAPEGSTNETVDKLLAWNAIDCCGYPTSENIDDVDFVNGVVETLRDLTLADTSNVVATGFSNGGFFVSLLGLLQKRPSWLKAIVPTGGYQYDTLLYNNAVASLPMFAHHGGADTVVRPAGCCLDPTKENGKSNCPLNIGSLRNTCLPIQQAFTLWTNINGCNDTLKTNATSGATCWIGSNCQAKTELCIWPDAEHVWGRTLPGADMVGAFLEELRLNKVAEKNGLDYDSNSLRRTLYPFLAVGTLVVVVLAIWIHVPRKRKRGEEGATIDEDELMELVDVSSTGVRTRTATHAVNVL